MHEFKIGDAVRIKGQRGRPQKWVIHFLDNASALVTQYNPPNSEQRVALNNLAPYPVKAAKVEEVV